VPWLGARRYARTLEAELKEAQGHYEEMRQHHEELRRGYEELRKRLEAIGGLTFAELEERN
jgi:hypothetical protein